MRVLVVEDDPVVASGVKQGLEKAGYSVDHLSSAEQAEAALQHTMFALAIIDIGLPEMDGLELIRRVRGAGNPVPVLILTARDAVSERVKALDGGADDFLTKPFDLDELAARIRALLRRHAGRATPLITHGALVLNPVTRQATINGRSITMSVREFAIAMALLDRPGVVLSRAQIEEKLYGWDAEVESNAVEVHIHSLRKKLGKDFIKNIRGVGYMVSTRT